MFEYLHNINTGIIENLDFYHLNYVFSIILVITFITITFNIGIPSVKRMLQNDKMYFRILLTMVVLDAVFSTMLVFYEIFAHQNIWGALMVIIIAMIVLLNSG
ncbi:MAG: hypothetical protein H6767_08090 [Candidatus Peribacteria bacterium]|nr:MAG: hypothetical protein H6767_08090 [Candidatus Peribacteria bacterium]